MQRDLAFAHASVDWAEANLPSLESRMQAWLDINMDIRIEEIEANPTDDLLIAFEKEDLPLSFSVEVGAYINTLRSSLDILATALAYRHGMPNQIKAHFPIATSEARFLAGEHKGSDFKNRLPEPERQKIEALKPYKGGNALLWELHDLDNVRKHRRLLDAQTRPARLRSRGRRLVPVAELVHANGETILGFVPKGAHQSDYQVTALVTLWEPGMPTPRPAMVVLRQFASLAREIISRFDAP